MVEEQSRDRRFLHNFLLLAMIAGASCGAPAPGNAEGATPELAPPSAAALYVAPDGSDLGDGSFQHPFAGLARAAAAARIGQIKTVLVEGGHYPLAQSIVLDAANTGLAVIAYPGQRPVFDGGAGIRDPLLLIRGASKVMIAGLGFTSTAPDGTALRLEAASGNTIVGNDFSQIGTAIFLRGSSDNLISGNRIVDAAHSGIEILDASNDNQVDSNLIDGAGTPDTQGGGIMVHGADDNRITHNLVRNTAGMGIGIENWDSHTINFGTVIAYNIVRNVDLASEDSGAIYVLGRSQVDTGTIIAGNLVDGSGPSTSHSVGIYLDDSTSGTTVTGNIVRRPGSDALQIHGGSRNAVANNIFDLGAGRASAILFQAAPADTRPANQQVGNSVRHNIIYATGPQPKVYVWIDGGQPEIADNLYYSAQGADMSSAPPTVDASPRFGDPAFADPDGGDYAVLPGSPAAAVGFAPIDQFNIGLRPLTAYAYPCRETLAAGCPQP